MLQMRQNARGYELVPHIHCTHPTHIPYANSLTFSVNSKNVHMQVHVSISTTVLSSLTFWNMSLSAIDHPHGNDSLLDRVQETKWLLIHVQVHTVHVHYYK